MCKFDAETLFKLGFKRPDVEEKISQTDVYYYKDEYWCVGGRILPNSNIIADSEIYEKGLWIPDIRDYIYWLSYNDCTYSVSYSGTVYKIEVQDPKGKSYKEKAGTLEYAFYKVVVRLLQKYGGNIVKKSCSVIHAEYLGEEKL